MRVLYDKTTLWGEARHPYEPWMNSYRTKKEPTAVEWWYFQIDDIIHDYHVVVVAFARYLLDSEPRIRVMVRGPDIEDYLYEEKISHENFLASTEKCDVTFRNSFIREIYQNLYQVHVETPKYSIDFEMKNLIPGWQPNRDPVITFKRENKPDAYVTWLVPCPRGSFQGEIKINNKSTKLKIKGTGYQDHNFGLAKLGAIDGWYWNRIQVMTEDSRHITLLAAKLIITGEEEVNVSMLAIDDEIQVSTGESKIRTEDYAISEVMEKEYPKIHHIILPDVPDQLSGSAVLQVSRIMEELDHLEGDPLVKPSRIQEMYSKMFFSYIRLFSKVKCKLNLKGKEILGIGTATHEVLTIYNQQWRSIIAKAKPKDVLEVFTYRKSSPYWGEESIMQPTKKK